MRSNATVTTARSQVESVAAAIRQEVGSPVGSDFRFRIDPLHERLARAGRATLLLMSFGAVFAMKFFEPNFAKATMLILFVPLIISSGGNSGSQAATLVVRAMALEEVSLKDWWAVMRREIWFGMVLGVTLAFLGTARLVIGARLGEQLGAEWATLSLVVGVSLVVVVIWGVTIGSMLPFLLRKLGADPATSSTPFVATIVDVTGLILYFFIAAVLM